MAIKIALAGNPNCGKTTLFNALTGSNQYVGNWPGVTVEKKEGRLKGDPEVIMQDLPGIYSLSPYTQEEVVTRVYLVNEKPDAILNIVDATNIERNLYLSTQLAELGIPMVIALNMMDLVRKNGDTINIEKLGAAMGCEVVEISAMKGENIELAAAKAVEAVRSGKGMREQHIFLGDVEHALAHIEDFVNHNDGLEPVHHHHADGATDIGCIVPDHQMRWYAVKLFERDERVLKALNLPEGTREAIESVIRECETILDDDAEAIITDQRYNYIGSLMSRCLKRGRPAGTLSVSDKIDRVVTNRVLALPIFAALMFVVYFFSVSSVGGIATDFINDGIFGSGWHLFGNGTAEYEAATEEYAEAMNAYRAFEIYGEENGIAVPEDLNSGSLAVFAGSIPSDARAELNILLDADSQENETREFTAADLNAALPVLEASGYAEPRPEEFGIWVPSIPSVLEGVLSAVNCAAWLKSLILDGIVAGVGSVLGFVPQMAVLFFFLSLLEECGYMSRIAFILDRIFRRFGLSGKSFIPILISTGCGVPGIMASRTIENVEDRRMTVMTTTFIPCSAKLPVIAAVAGAAFGGAAWVAPSTYFLGIIAIIASGIMLKKTRLFTGEMTPFVMELPAYHVPTASSIFRTVSDRVVSFVQKALTVITLSTIVVWFLSNFGFIGGTFRMLDVSELDRSILAVIGGCLSWVFIPTGFGFWQTTAASITGLVAKENLVSTLGILFHGEGSAFYATFAAAMVTPIAAYSYLIFNLLDAPCFAALSAIRREMNSKKWFWIAVGYQCGFAWLVALIIYRIGGLLTGQVALGPWTFAAFAAAAFLLWMLLRPTRKKV